MVLKELAEHLALEASAYRDLVGLLQKETRDLVERDYKALYDTVDAKGQAVGRIEALGRRRAPLIAQAAGDLSLGVDANLSAIIARIESPMKGALARLQETILALIESVTEINSLNTLVVKGSLENIGKTLGFLGGFMPGTTYKRGGTIEGASPKGQRLSEGA